MPITGWVCQACGGRDVALDHFANTKCGLDSVHPSYAAAVLDHERKHYARGSGVAEVSNGLGCPRESAIMATESVSIDPLKNNAAIGGTAWHGLIEGYPEGGQVEHVVRGWIDGVPVQGKIDRLRRPVIEDWKTKTDWKARSIAKDGAEPDHVAQLSLYAELVEQQDKWRPMVGIIWYRFHASGIKPITVRLWSITETLDYRPAKGRYSVRELLHQTDDFLGGRTTWQDLPLVGEHLTYGDKSKCDYCPVFRTCQTAARGAAF